MFKKQFQESIRLMVTTFNVFIRQANDYIRQYAYSENKSLVQMVSIWAHPKGLANLIKIIGHEYQTEVSYPQTLGLSENVVLAKPLDIGYSQEISRIDPEIQKYESKSRHSKRIKKNQEKKKNNENKIYDSAQSEEQRQLKNSQSQLQASQFSASSDRKYKRGPYKNYTTEEKIEAVELYFQQKLSITEISKKLGIPCKNIKRWATEGVSRKAGGGRRRTNPMLEEDVYKWLINQYAPGQNISMDLIQEYALSLSTDPHFKASRGWAIKFIERFKLRGDYNIA